MQPSLEGSVKPKWDTQASELKGFSDRIKEILIKYNKK